MTDFGIDTLCFYTPKQYLDLNTLAVARKTSIDKYHTGLGQHQMSVPAPGEDIITMAANAANMLLEKVNKNGISLIIFATESSIDQSKSSAIYLHHLLDMPNTCRAVELKQACYSATAGLQLALSHVASNPHEKALIVASDIPRYGLNSPGEPSHGAGAVAMCISANPRTMVITPHAGYYTEDHMDFWRPNYKNEAIVAGKLSCELYFRFLLTTWALYQKKSGLTINDHDHFCFHTPIPRLVEKALSKLLHHNHIDSHHIALHLEKLQSTLLYSRRVGNCYTASLYLSLISLLDHNHNLDRQRVALYSYGSGSTAEFFAGVVQENYREVLFTKQHSHILDNRTELDLQTYEAFYGFEYPTHGNYFEINKHQTGNYRLVAMDQHKRIYRASIDE
jgi:hydroxymethylglutaryl-CoA synthase